MSDASLHLVLGEEELLVDRAVAQIVSDVRTRSGTPGDLPVSRLRAGDAGVPELAELLSPSLFAEERIVILESTADAGKDAAALILDVAADPPPGVTLVILHSGGGRTKAMVPALRKCGAEEHMCAAPAKAGEKAAWVRTFVHKEFQAADVRVSGDVEQLVIEAVGSDLRELAAACSQLVADTGGKIDAAAVRRYYSGKAEVSGFDVAEKAVAGDTAGALEALRWAMHRGVAHVLLADALADAVHTIARVAPPVAATRSPRVVARYAAVEGEEGPGTGAHMGAGVDRDRAHGGRCAQRRRQGSGRRSGLRSRARRAGHLRTGGLSRPRRSRFRGGVMSAVQCHEGRPRRGTLREAEPASTTSER